MPGARVARLDRDAIRRRGALTSLLARFRDGDIDVLVGTQMVTKGHDLPGVTARSAGIRPKALHPHAVTVMAERGIDIAGRPSTHVDDLAPAAPDRVVTLCDRARATGPDLLRRPPAVHWSMADPATEGGGTLRAFRSTADEIDGRVRHLAALLAA